MTLAHQTDRVVLHVRVVTETGGGPEKTILNSPAHLEKRGYRGVCAYLHPPHDPGFAEIQKRALTLNVDLISVPDRGPWDLRVVWQLLKLCRNKKVTIWHGHDYKSNAIGLLLRLFHRMHLVTTVHGWVRHTKRTPLYYWIDRLSLRFYKKIVCVSEDLLQACVASGVPPAKCRLILNAIDTITYAPASDCNSSRERLGIPADRFLIGSVGRLSIEKGYNFLIDAVDRLIKDGHNIFLLIIGEGDIRGDLEAQIERLGLRDRIQLTGYQSNTIELYRAMDLFVLASLREGLPNALLEAMAMEVPVVATRVGGIPQVICDRENGVLVEPGDSGVLADAVREMVVHREPASNMARRARETVEQNYSFERRMERMVQLYADLDTPRHNNAGSTTKATATGDLL
jgi:glycosyltransferase involved in cell wall biosynthesis